MKTIIYECDICKDKTEKDQLSRVRITDESPDMSLFSNKTPGEWLFKDACTDCRERIMKFIKEMEWEYKNEKSD